LEREEPLFSTAALLQHGMGFKPVSAIIVLLLQPAAAVLSLIFLLA
jgi:hypothetical protein